MSGNTTRNVAAWTAPVLCAALLLAEMRFGFMAVPETPGVEAYQADVRGAIERMPYRVGDWIGADVAAPLAAVKLLKPNMLLQRRYTNTVTHEVVSVLIVHCGDVNDMLGHYPPVCYPAHGWTEESREDTTAPLAGHDYPARQYVFRRINRGAEQTMTVVNFFVVPDASEHIVSNMERLQRLAQRREAAGLGSAQVQIVGGEGMTEERRREVVAQFVGAIEPVIREIAEGVDHG